LTWKEKLWQYLEKPPLLEERMAPYTSYGIGGPAEAMVFPQNEGELLKVLSLARDHEVPVFILGRGTNLLVKDKGVRGMVLNLKALCRGCVFDGNVLRAGAALSLKSLVGQSVNQGLQGLEFAAGIPGSVGGAIYMNAGAYGSNIGERVLEVKLLDCEGNSWIRSRRELDFSYRWSNLQQEKAIILEATLQLAPGDKEALREQVRAVIAERRLKQPSLPSAGSVFRNPRGRAAGQLVEMAGAKGMKVGGAVVSLLHGNFIVNTGGATARDVLLLVEKVRNKVKNELGVELDLEIEIVGDKGQNEVEQHG